MSAGMSDAELAAMEAAVEAERERRRLAAERLAERDRLLRQVAEYQVLLGRAGGDPWERPDTVLDSYPHGAVVTHGGLYESLVQMNMKEPGTDPDSWAAVQDGETV